MIKWSNSLFHYWGSGTGTGFYQPVWLFGHSLTSKRLINDLLFLFRALLLRPSATALPKTKTKTKRKVKNLYPTDRPSTSI